MASGLLKYVGRSPEPPQSRNDDMKDRLKARMERMGMIESGGPQPPTDHARHAMSQAPSNRQVIASQARVTPRSFNLSHGTKAPLPVTDTRWKPSAKYGPPLQRRDSLIEGPNDRPQDGDEGGMFDTDAENLDSTTNFSDVGDRPISRSWQHDTGDSADVPRNPFQGGFIYEGVHRPTEEHNLSAGYAGSEEILVGEHNEVEMLSSEEDDNAYQDGTNGQHRHETQAMRNLSPDQGNIVEHSRMVEAPTLRQMAIDTLMDSPSIQQSLAYRTLSGRSRPIKSDVHSMLDVTSEEMTQPSAMAEGALQYRQDMWKPSVKPDSQIKERSYSQTAKDHLEQPDLVVHKHSKIAPDLKAHDRLANKAQVAQSFPQKEIISPRSVSARQHVLSHGENQLVVTAEDRLKGKPHAASDHIAGNDSMEVVKLQYGSVSGDIPDNQDGVSTSLSAQAIDPNAAVPKASILPHTDLEQARQPADLRPFSPANSLMTDLQKPQLRKRALSLDYSPQELYSMPYKILGSESFDHIHQSSIVTLPPELAQATLVEKLHYVYDLNAETDQRLSQRRAIFGQLTIEQHEETGDLLLANFANVINHYREARRVKRSIAKEFEKDIAQREELVRAKSLAVERDLTGLKTAGQRVIDGKYT